MLACCDGLLVGGQAHHRRCTRQALLGRAGRHASPPCRRRAPALQMKVNAVKRRIAPMSETEKHINTQLLGNVSVWQSTGRVPELPMLAQVTSRSQP